MKLKSLDVSNVMYLEGDKIGKLLAFLSLSPIFIMVFYVTLVVSRRELSVGFILLGQLLNELFNGILKDYWKEPRPSELLGDGYGCPSSHSQYMGYIIVVWTWYIWSRMQLELNIFKLPLNIAVIGLCLVVCYSRYYLNYHTLSQISLGFQLGIIFGFLWLFAIEVVFRNMGGFEYLEEFSLFKYWYFKDSSNIGNILKVERDYLISLREKTKIKSN